MLYASRSTQGAIIFFLLNKARPKKIMTTTRLRYKFSKDTSEENKKKYSKHRNYCVSLLRKSKSGYFGNVHEKNNKTFWKSINPFWLDKVTSTNKTELIEKEETIMDDCNTAKVLNTFFSNIVSPLMSQNTQTMNLLLTISVILF